MTAAASACFSIYSCELRGRPCSHQSPCHVCIVCFSICIKQKGTADVRKGKPVSSARGSSGSRSQETPTEPGSSRRQQKQQQVPGGSASRTTSRSGAKPLTAGPAAASAAGGSKQQVDGGASHQKAADLAGLQGKKQPLNRPTNVSTGPSLSIYRDTGLRMLIAYFLCPLQSRR